MQHPEPSQLHYAYKLSPFMESHDARLIRIHCELLEPEVRLRKAGIHNTIVFFGSARILEPHTAQAQQDAVYANPAATAAERLIASNALKMSVYYTQAEALAAELTQWSLAQDPQNRHVICSGGNFGIMEAANRGAHRVGGVSIGFGIDIPSERKANSYIPPELNFKFQYFFARKFWFLNLARAIIVFPGGLGTLDELFEVLTLLKTHRMTLSTPLILYGSAFWRSIINFPSLVDNGLVTQDELECLHFCDCVQEAFTTVTKGIR